MCEKQLTDKRGKIIKIVISVMSRHRGKGVSCVSSLTTTREEEEETTTTNTETKVQLVFDDEGPGEGNRKSRNVRRRHRNTTHQTSLTNSMMKTMKMMTKMMRKKTRGYLAVFLVSAIWVCASFIVKDLERVGDPLTLTALFNALFLVYWPVEMKGYFYHLAEKKKKKRRYHHYAMFRKWKESNVSTRGISSFLRENEALRCYVIVPPLFFLAQFYFNKSLQFVSVTVNTALSSVAPALTYVFGIYRGLEKPVRDSNGFLKALGLVAIGVVLTAVADDETTFGGASGMTAGGDEDSPRTRNENNSYNSYSSFVNMDTAWGVLLILASAVCYAGYATEVEIALNAVKVSDGHRDENRSRSSNQNFSRNNRVGGVLLEEREEREEEEEEDEDEEDEEREREAAEVNEGAAEEITGRRQMKTEAKKELLAAIKDSKSRQILASVGTFAFVIVLCTMRKSILSMNKSGGMIVLKGLIDNALAEYLWCVGVAELGASVASIGLLLQIPLSAVAELLFVRADEEVWTRTTGGIFAMFCGCALIVYGFIGAMKFAGSSEEDEEDEEDDEDDDEDDEDDADDNATIARAPLL